jgi:hypothetical protein
MSLATKCVFGAYGNNGGSSIVAPFWDGSPRYVFNQNGVYTDNQLWNSPATWSDSRRFAIGSRTSSTAVEGGINNTFVAKTSSIVSTVRPDVEVYGLTMNYLGNPTFYSDNEISFISQGTGLTTSEMTLLNGAVDTLMTSLGINV